MLGRVCEGIKALRDNPLGWAGSPTELTEDIAFSAVAVFVDFLC